MSKVFQVKTLFSRLVAEKKKKTKEIKRKIFIQRRLLCNKVLKKNRSHCCPKGQSGKYDLRADRKSTIKISKLAKGEQTASGLVAVGSGFEF